MAWSFGDGFDLYAAVADMDDGYWDAASAPGINMTTQAGRFSGSQSIRWTGTTGNVVKASGSNDAVHHFAVAFQQTSALSGSTLCLYLELFDGATAQCSIVFRSDGAILLTSGGPAGTVLATYSGAVAVISTWYHFEFEVVINNTTGSFKVRKNGNTTEDFTATSLDTQNSANAYANKLQVGVQAGAVNQYIDDLFWRSDASSVAWLGDIRCYTRMPASDASVTWSRTPTTMLLQNNPSVSAGSARSTNTLYAAPLMPTSGTVTSLACQLNAGVTGHIKMALYDSTGASGNAGTLLASSTELTNPSAGLNTFTIAGGPTVARGTTCWIAVWSDVAFTLVGGSSVAVGIAANSGNTVAATYAGSFPSSFGTPTGTLGVSGGGCLGMNVTPINAGCVNEPQQDAATSYVYSSTVNDADLYGIASIASTPATVIATTVRAYMQKSDAGTRTAAVQLKSGGTTVASPTLTLTTSGWLWAWRTDLTDPATGTAWTAAAVNNATIGPKVIA